MKKHDINEMMGQISHIRCDEIYEFVKGIIKKYDYFKECPGAMNHHHNYKGGLLDHTYEVTNSCITFCNDNPTLDKDTVIAGAVLHDIGKLFCYSFNNDGTILKTVEEGRYGHFILGHSLLEKHKDTLNETDYNWICHILLSHHGNVSQGLGSVVDPQTPEAVLVSQADLLSARVQSKIQGD